MKICEIMMNKKKRERIANFGVQFEIKYIVLLRTIPSNPYGENDLGGVHGSRSTCKLNEPEPN